MEKPTFQQPLLQYSVSHDLSEVRWFGWYLFVYLFILWIIIILIIIIIYYYWILPINEYLFIYSFVTVKI